MEFDTEKRYYVYAWYVKDTNEVFYIGKGTGRRYLNRKRENEFFMRMMKTHDCESKILIDNLDEETAFKLEKVVIAIYRLTDCRLTNVTDGGENPPKMCGERPAQWKENQAKAVRKSYRDNPNRGKRQSDAMKSFLKTDRGKEFTRKSVEAKKTKEFRARQSITVRKFTRTPEYRKKLSEKTSEYYRIHGAYECMIGKNNHHAQKVFQCDLCENIIEVYDTMTEASKATGVSVSKISAVCRGARKTAGGFIWRFATDKRLSFKRNSKSIPNHDLEKPIVQYAKDGTLIKEYASIASACRDGGFKNRSNIICALKGRTKTAYGYVWKYK